MIVMGDPETSNARGFDSELHPSHPNPKTRLNGKMNPESVKIYLWSWWMDGWMDGVSKFVVTKSNSNGRARQGKARQASPCITLGKKASRQQIICSK